jgi:hypothetical protein
MPPSSACSSQARSTPKNRKAK